mmetsp:Transcript_17489/g.47896  ORF Transcript_17489/g.47896 Transcript_17489/m.47896 type:complete len:244 (-) Transcript_17489:501-1232(-)
MYLAAVFDERRQGARRDARLRLGTCRETTAAHAAVQLLEQHPKKVLLLPRGHVGELPRRMLVIRRGRERVALSLVLEFVERRDDQASALILQLCQSRVVAPVVRELASDRLQGGFHSIQLPSQSLAVLRLDGAAVLRRSLHQAVARPLLLAGNLLETLDRPLGIHGLRPFPGLHALDDLLVEIRPLRELVLQVLVDEQMALQLRVLVLERLVPLNFAVRLLALEVELRGHLLILHDSPLRGVV